MLDAKIICHRFVSDFRVKKIHLLTACRQTSLQLFFFIRGNTPIFSRMFCFKEVFLFPFCI